MYFEGSEAATHAYDECITMAKSLMAEDIKTIISNSQLFSDFIKEYVTRRYILERDIKHIDHKYPIFGDLSPFLTLFMPRENYESLGYDTEDIAIRCIISRVDYKKSRNPVIRRLNNA